jgi:hypothetical protein
LGKGGNDPLKSIGIPRLFESYFCDAVCRSHSGANLIPNWGSALDAERQAVKRCLGFQAFKAIKIQFALNPLKQERPHNIFDYF